MSRLWLAGGTRIDPAGGTTGDLFVEGGVIAEPPADRAGWRRVDCTGAWVAPGFVDLYADLADPEIDGAAALRGGFTTVVQGPVPALDTPVAVRERLARV
nr:hypothetical protein [Deltaproteobacteria bacterium]